jgi:hypothetical protein
MTGRERRELEFVQFVRSMLRPARPSVFTAAWRWRYEIALVIGIPALLIESIRTTGIGWTALAMMMVPAGIFLLPGGVQAVIRRFWCVVTPHRFRVGCAEALILTRTGKLPVVFLVRSLPFGERVFVWCRGGTTPHDLDDVRDGIAAACWAIAVRVQQSPRYANVAIVDVIRRR